MESTPKVDQSTPPDGPKGDLSEWLAATQSIPCYGVSIQLLSDDVPSTPSSSVNTAMETILPKVVVDDSDSPQAPADVMPVSDDDLDSTELVVTLGLGEPMKDQQRGKKSPLQESFLLSPSSPPSESSEPKTKITLERTTRGDELESIGPRDWRPFRYAVSAFHGMNSWLHLTFASFQVACQSLGPLEKGGLVLGVDVKKVKVPVDHCDVRVKTLCADVLRLDSHRLLVHAQQEKGFSVILSDMCPPVSGIGSKDAALSNELGLKALRLAVGGHLKFQNEELDIGQSEIEHGRQGEHGVLLPGGNLVIKLLEGGESQGFPKICKGMFKSTAWLRPKATRPASREIYFIAKGLR
ncbi:hypothetical protein L7F22_013091 [Adiantum nelumboides]|nr:hypothetical protein [Adiantum nelumboides]